MVRTTLTILGYSLLVDVVAWCLITSPVYALLTSSTGYVRVVPATSQLAYLNANRAALLSTVGTAIASQSPASVAVRMVTGPVGWAALGVSVGLAVTQLYYGTDKVAAIRQATNGDGSMVSGTGAKMPWPQLTPTSCTAGAACAPGTQQATLDDPNAYPYCGYYWVAPPAPPGWSVIVEPKPGITLTTGCTTCCHYVYTNSQASSVQNATPGYVGPADAAHVTNYLSNLPATDPAAPQNTLQPLGQGVTPSNGDSTTTVPVSPTDTQTVVKPISQVQSTDAVVNPNATGTQQTTSTTSTTQSTTTNTVTNPDGSKTDTVSATASCTSGFHEDRTFGAILQAHMTTWSGSGIAGALTTLKTLTWPSDIPVYTFHSSLFGTFTVNFADWAVVLTALRSLIIAAAGFVAYRIVFVGNA